MEPRHCKREGCPYTIDAEKRSDAVYHSPECGWKDRNRKNALQDKEKLKLNSILNKNYKIIKDLYRKGILDVSLEALELLGFDFDLYTNFVTKNFETKISVIMVFEYKITIQGSRCQINKLLL